MPRVQVNGIGIDYRIEGRGDPLILVLGYSADRSSWMFQLPAFRKRFRVLTFDNRGAGRSDKPPGPYTTRMMAEDTVCLMDALGIPRAHVLGVSMGGMIAQEIAINHPERVSRLVLGATYACRDRAENGGTPELEAALGLPIQKFTARLVGMAAGSLPMRMFALPLLRLRVGWMGEAAKRGLRGQLDACLGHNAAGRLGAIRSPTLVMVGDADRVIKPGSSDLLVTAIPGAKASRFEGGSHLFCADMAGRFNAEVLAFLSGG